MLWNLDNIYFLDKMVYIKWEEELVMRVKKYIMEYFIVVCIM